MWISICYNFVKFAYLGLTLETPLKCWSRELNSVQLIGAPHDTADDDEETGNDGGDERSNGDWPEVLGGAGPGEGDQEESNNYHPLA